MFIVESEPTLNKDLDLSCLILSYLILSVHEGFRSHLQPFIYKGLHSLLAVLHVKSVAISTDTFLASFCKTPESVEEVLSIE